MSAMNALVPMVLFMVSSALAHSQYPSIKKTARFLTLQTWEGRVEEMLAKRGAATGAPSAWHAGDPHWDAAKAKELARFGKAVDELLEAPDPERIASKSFTTVLDDHAADLAGARLSGPLGAELVNYSDNVIIAVELMMQKNVTNPLDPAVREETKRRQAKAGLHQPPNDAALNAA